MTTRTDCHGLQVDAVLQRFIDDKVLPGTGLTSDAFWKGFAQIANDLAPKNAALLAERDRLQHELDQWHKAHPGPIADVNKYREFFRINWLLSARA